MVKLIRPLRAFCLFLLALTNAPADTIKVFILAGQSNMEGQAVTDLKGKDYNKGKGTLVEVISRPGNAARYAHLKNTDGSWRFRDDVFVRYERENQPPLQGPLGLGFAVYGDLHHFGPELQCGHVLGDAIDAPVLLIKCAWGGKSLYQDFRPPSAGGVTGKYYKLMLQQVRTGLSEVGKDFPTLAGKTPELAGLIWYQGWNDGVNPQTAVPEYESNLAHLIRDIRRDLDTPKLPVVIGELTGPWVQAPEEWEALRHAQAAVARRPEFIGNTLYVPTRDFVRPASESPNPGHGHHEFGNAETYFLVGDALGKGMLALLHPSGRQIVPRGTK